MSEKWCKKYHIQPINFHFTYTQIYMQTIKPIKKCVHQTPKNLRMSENTVSSIYAKDRVTLCIMHNKNAAILIVIHNKTVQLHFLNRILINNTHTPTYICVCENIKSTT